MIIYHEISPLKIINHLKLLIHKFHKCVPVNPNKTTHRPPNVSVTLAAGTRLAVLAGNISWSSPLQWALLWTRCQYI